MALIFTGFWLKEEGLFLKACEVADDIGKNSLSHLCDADKLYFELKRRGINPSPLGNATGPIFLDKTKWKQVGRKLSIRLTNHAHNIGVWRYIGT